MLRKPTDEEAFSILEDMATYLYQATKESDIEKRNKLIWSVIHSVCDWKEAVFNSLE